MIRWLRSLTSRQHHQLALESEYWDIVCRAQGLLEEAQETGEQFRPWARSLRRMLAEVTSE